MSRLIPLLTGILLSLLVLFQPLHAEDQAAAAQGGNVPPRPVAIVEPAEAAPAELVPVRRGSALLNSFASKLAAEKAAKEKASPARTAEKAAADKTSAQKSALIKAAAEKASADRAAQRTAAKAAEDKAEALKTAAQKAAAEKALADKAAKRAAERVAEEKADAEKASRKAAEKAAAEKALAERRAADKAAEEKKAAEKLALAEQKAAERLAAEKAAADKAAADKAAAEKFAADKAAAEKAAAEKFAADKAAAEKAAAEKIAAEKAVASQQSLAAKLAAGKTAAEKEAAAQAAAPKPEAVLAKPAPVPAPAPVIAESPAPAPPAHLTPVSWQSRYELGPGDVLNFGIHGKPTMKRLNVPVAPDGTISYLQARQVDVRGKTIDELREELNEVLKPYQGEGRVIIAPARLGSKRYTLLGEVRNNGTYPLDRPTTLLQAIAMSGGINLGVSGEDAIELADLRRSFVVRHGNRVNVDMEGLYLRGDMSQNVHLEPGDYVYVASKIRNEIYVFGAVAQPGVKSIDSSMSTLGAISAAGGFGRDAWRDKVLVIRGRLDQPQTFVVELNKVLHGNAQDFELEPGDIVYAHTRPWAFAERLLDVAIKSFIDGSISGSLADSGVAVSANGAAF